MNVGTGNLAIRLSVLSRNISSGETQIGDSALSNKVLSILGVRLEKQRYPSPVGYSSALEVRDVATRGFAGCSSSVLTSAMALYVDGKL